MAITITEQNWLALQAATRMAAELTTLMEQIRDNRTTEQNVTRFALLTLALGETFTMHETVRANLAALGVTDQASALAWWHAR